MALTAAELRKIGPGRHPAGKNLLFRVTDGSTREWYLRVQRNGVRREFKLGDYPALSLSQAREKAGEWRELVKQGHDPSSRLDVPTFKELAEEYITTRLSNKAKRSVDQWHAHLSTYVYPFIGNTDVDKIQRRHIEKILLQPQKGGPFWTVKHVTADRVRMRVHRILQRASDHDYCGKNVAAGIQDDLPSVRHTVRHHPMMPLNDIADFFHSLRSVGNTDQLTRLAIEFGCLTVARSEEVRKARWEEIFDDVWVLPKDRTKQRVINEILLSDRSLEILEEARSIANGPYIFWSRAGQPKSDNTLNKSVKEHYVRRFGEPKVDIPVFHGFRASFKTWAEEYDAPFSERVIEAMQGHQHEKSKVRASYNRARYTEQRRKASQMWTDFVMGRDV
ncbi:integrase arm-type DNA-binding domain-containing protein [Luminiphilus sp.]|nr:integrase arm-type DNA-binding domain-containing protein [Luminiphilus sp.]